MRREILCCLFAFGLLTPAAAKEPTLVCDGLCWLKDIDLKKLADLQQLNCRRVFRTDEEGAYWKSLVTSGVIAIGKTMNVVSSDVDKPDGGGANCFESSSKGVRVTGFALHAKICNSPGGRWTAGYVIDVRVCGVAVNGPTSVFFPAPPLPP